MRLLHTANDYGRHFSGYYTKPANANYKHASKDVGVIIDMDDSLWADILRDEQDRKSRGIKSYRHASIIKRKLWTITTISLSIILGVIISITPLAFIGVYTIPSGSMEDTLMVGDRIIISKAWVHDSTVKRGDVIVFKDPAGWMDGTPHNGDTLIKRVIGLPGDTVEAGQDGIVKVNGHPLNESGYVKGDVGSEVMFSVRVTAGNVFVMGDNRANSADSRYHMDDGNNGLVPMSDIIGRTEAVYWPLSDTRYSGVSQPLKTMDGKTL